MRLRRCPGPAGQCLSWARRATAPSFGKSKFHISSPPCIWGELGSPTLQSPTGTDPPMAPGGIFQRKDWAKAVFSAGDHWTEFLAVASWKFSRIFPHQLLPEALLCAAIYWCTSTKLAAATSDALCTCRTSYSNNPSMCYGIFVYNFLIPALLVGQIG